jgi:hypothetical protein
MAGVASIVVAWKIFRFIIFSLVAGSGTTKKTISSLYVLTVTRNFTGIFPEPSSKYAR